MTWMATSDRIRRRTRTRTDGGGVCPFISHCISLSRLPPSRCGFESRRRRLAGPSTPPASPFRSAFLGCGNDGRDYLLSWRPAVRLISINLISIKVKGGTDEGDSAALAFRSELSGQGRRREEDDAWRPGGGGGVPSCDGERDVEGAGDLGIVGRALHRTGGPVRVRGRVSRVGGDAWRRFPSGSEGSVDAHGEDQGWWRDHPHHQDSRRER